MDNLILSSASDHITRSTEKKGENMNLITPKNMSITIITMVAASLLFAGMVTVVNADPVIRHVDDDGGQPFSSIQSAIDAADAGDTVFVYAGTYFESVTINKTLILTGEEKSTTVVDGGRAGATFHISHGVSDVMISGFTIHGPGVGPR